MERLIDKRLHQRSEQVKQQAIYEIFELMEFHGITAQDLKKVKTRNYMDELTKLRTKKRHRKERQDALKKAREKRWTKQLAKREAKENAEIQAQREKQKERYIKKEAEEVPSEPA